MNQFNDNKEISELSKFINDQCSKQCFDLTHGAMDYYGIESADPRVPNESERRQWVIRQLMRFRLGKYDEMNTAVYRSLKGMVRRGNIEPIFRFLEKRGESEIRKSYEEYCNSKCMVDYKIKAKLPNTISKIIIDINIQKGEENGGTKEED